MENSSIKKSVLSLACVLALSTSFMYADTDLAQQANDPTAPLMAVQLIDGYTSDFYNGLEGENANSISFRAAYPYKWGETNHIARVTLPVVTDSPTGDTGIQDMTLFDMGVFATSWGRYGVGLVGSIPLADGNEQWSVGPAFGFVNNTLSKGLNIGLFNQNLFRVAGNDDRPDTKISSLQPILNYSMGGGWNIGTGDIQYIYDWESSQWASLPVGLQVGKLHKFGKLPVVFSLQYVYNFADEVTASNGFLAPTPKTNITFTAKFLFPTF
ncbi:hypothetical protein ACLHDG_05240 [Sulfurovum sp. CS9]|uniref:hypothetical protein n=1 Tax=Sulfurovum sp. CS9 TaxID=3391146 RepID=UPI0039EBC4C3